MYTSLEDIQEKNQRGEYTNNKPHPSGKALSESHIFDEEQSVRWNKEQVAAHNKGLEDARKKHLQECIDLEKKFKEDVIQALHDEYGFVLSHAKKIYERAWDNKRSAGYNCVIEEARDLADFVQSVIQA